MLFGHRRQGVKKAKGVIMSSFNSRVIMTNATREWLKELLKKLEKNQSAVAERCALKPAWFSMLLTGRTSKHTPDMITKLKAGLTSIVNEYEGAGKDLLLREVEQNLSQLAPKTIGPPTADILRIAADILEILEKRCPEPHERRQVIEFLKVAVK